MSSLRWVLSTERLDFQIKVPLHFFAVRFGLETVTADRQKLTVNHRHHVQPLLFSSLLQVDLRNRKLAAKVLTEIRKLLAALSRHLDSLKWVTIGNGGVLSAHDSIRGDDAHLHDGCP